MAVVSDFRVNWRAEPGDSAAEIPLEALPFEAALIDKDGLIVAANCAWVAAHPKTAVGATCAKWCDRVLEASPGLRARVVAGLEGVLKGLEKRFEQNYGNPASPSRIFVSACPRGALILHQPEPAADAPFLPEERRWQAHKMETIGRLVGGVAHDFANLLTMIAGYGDILLNRLGEKDPLRPELDEIRKAANRGSQLTAQLLGFTRGQTVQPRAIDLNGVVTDMQRMLQPVIGEYIELRTALKPGLGKVVADPGQMEQVIMNLVLNARDAMPTGGRIQIETGEEEIGAETASARGIEPGPCVLLSIRDNGHGIDPETMGHLFEPFFTTKEKGRGTGLGLSTVHSIVRQSAGAVWVESAPGAGAVFTICLPLARESGETREAVSAAGVTQVGSETVLLVEDEDGVRRLLRHVLHKRGYNVLEAANAEQALQIYAGRPEQVHLVLTDMVMPGMSGRELADQLRQIRPDVKIVFMSGYTDDVLVHTGALRPGMSFLQKPLRPDTLAATIREALDSPTRPFNPR